jgi:hypothetical protein
MILKNNSIKNNAMRRFSTKFIYDPSINIDVEMKDLAIEVY